jgi:hypothetical protein
VDYDDRVKENRKNVEAGGGAAYQVLFVHVSTIAFAASDSRRLDFLQNITLIGLRGPV